MTYDTTKSPWLLLVALAWACGGTDRSFVAARDGGVSDGQGGAAGSSAGAGGRKDGSTDGQGMGGSPTDAGDARIVDATVDVEDTGPPPPPPPPGRPGMAIVAGGTKMQSPSYKAVVATGESPGSNGAMSSPSYKLHGGVIGTTQTR